MVYKRNVVLITLMCSLLFSGIFSGPGSMLAQETKNKENITRPTELKHLDTEMTQLQTELGNMEIELEGLQESLPGLKSLRELELFESFEAFEGFKDLSGLAELEHLKALQEIEGLQQLKGLAEVPPLEAFSDLESLAELSEFGDIWGRRDEYSDLGGQEVAQLSLLSQQLASAQDAALPDIRKAVANSKNPGFKMLLLDKVAGLDTEAALTLIGEVAQTDSMVSVQQYAIKLLGRSDRKAAATILKQLLGNL